MPPRPLIAAHRGGTLEYGDSTPAGFRATAAMALEQVEFDVHPTADGAILVTHDPTLERTTDLRGRVAELSLAEIRAARLNHSPGEGPLTLPELCAIYRNASVDLRCEIKVDALGRPYPGFAAQVRDCLAAEGLLQRTVFSSFSYEVLSELQALGGLRYLWLLSAPVLEQVGLPGLFALARQAGIPEFGLGSGFATAEAAERIRQAGFEFGIWGAHDRAALLRAFELGAKVLTTDRPSLAIDLRNDWEAGRSAG